MESVNDNWRRTVSKEDFDVLMERGTSLMESRLMRYESLGGRRYSGGYAKGAASWRYRLHPGASSECERLRPLIQREYARIGCIATLRAAFDEDRSQGELVGRIMRLAMKRDGNLEKAESLAQKLAVDDDAYVANFVEEASRQGPEGAFTLWLSDDGDRVRARIEISAHAQTMPGMLEHEPVTLLREEMGGFTDADGIRAFMEDKIRNADLQAPQPLPGASNAVHNLFTRIFQKHLAA